MLFTGQVNFAISALGIDALKVDQGFRVHMTQVGKQSGDSPQEVALWIVSQLPLRIRCDYRPQTIKTWIRKRKINPDDAEMHRAMLEIGYL